MKTSLVITTINNPNKNIRSFEKNCKIKDWSFIVVGDKKTPKKFSLKYGNYYSLNDQKKLKLQFADVCYMNSYARKNIGYLIAIKDQNDIIIETDDDNYPYQDFFSDKKEFHQAKIIKNKNQWINIYNFFNKKKSVCWPRGILLDKIHNIKLKFGKKSVTSFLLASYPNVYILIANGLFSLCNLV